MAESNETRFPTAQQVSTASVAKLREGGLSARKAEYLIELATRFADGSVTDDKLESATDDEIDELLTSIRGIGQVSFAMTELTYSFAKFDAFGQCSGRSTCSRCLPFGRPMCCQSATWLSEKEWHLILG